VFHPAQWPHWLQMFLWISHGFLGFALTWFFWPKTNKQWKWFWILAVYLLLAYCFVLRKFTL
jgi:CHASE2 domain-containing sensor protein